MLKADIRISSWVLANALSHTQKMKGATNKIQYQYDQLDYLWVLRILISFM